MPRPSKDHTRILKTRIDPQEAGYEIVLAALDQILELGENETEAAAVRRLLHLGANAYFGTQVMQDAKRQTGPMAQHYLQRRRQPQVRTVVATPVKSKPEEEAAPSATQSEPPKMESAPEALRTAAPPVVPVAPSQMKVPEPTSQPESPAAVSVERPSEPPPTPVAVRPAAGGLMKLRSMALSQSVVPPEASAPRLGHK